MPTNHATQQQALQLNILNTSSKSRITLQGFLNVMDRFRNTIQVTGISARVGQTLSQASAEQSTLKNDMRTLFFQTIMIELIYGSLGLCVLTGILIFNYCSNQFEQKGWATVVRELIGGNNFLHFIAQQIALITGIVGLISINKNEGRNDLVFVIPILITLSNLLVGASNTKQSQKTDVVESLASSASDNNKEGTAHPEESATSSHEHSIPISPRHSISLFRHAGTDENRAPDHNTDRAAQQRPSASPTVDDAPSLQPGSHTSRTP